MGSIHLFLCLLSNSHSSIHCVMCVSLHTNVDSTLYFPPWHFAFCSFPSVFANFFLWMLEIAHCFRLLREILDFSSFPFLLPVAVSCLYSCSLVLAHEFNNVGCCYQLPCAFWRVYKTIGHVSHAWICISAAITFKITYISTLKKRLISFTGFNQGWSGVAKKTYVNLTKCTVWK